MPESQRLVTALKRELKVRGMTYRQLAEGLDVAESTIKRSFATGRLDFARLDAICDLLGLRLEDLVTPPDQAEVGLKHLTPKQEASLVDDPVRLLVAYCVVNRVSFDEILQRYAIDEHALIQHVAALDRLGLAELMPGNRIRARISTDFSWRADGPIERYFRSHVQTQFLNSDFDEEGALRLVRMGDISSSTLSQVVARLEAAGSLFDDLAREEQRLPESSKRGTLMILAVRHWEFAVFKGLERSATHAPHQGQPTQ